MRKAFIDLGTNTFHLLIVDASTKEMLYKTSIATKLGEGGINQKTLTSAAMERSLGVLKKFKTEIDDFGVVIANVFATGTSAIRNAENKAVFLKRVKTETGIEIQVISGDEEAILIYEGIKQAVELTEASLIIDIGGGSVEFIIADSKEMLWKQSFEIGGQRLMELFMKSDPISAKAIERLDTYFLEQLIPLANAVHQYRPKVLIGSSGSFDSLNDMYWMKTHGHLPENQVGFDYPLEAFFGAYEQLVFCNRTQRAEIPGMVELRVDMIVVAVCLIRFVIQTHGITSIKISNYALKEGLMVRFS